MDITLPTIPAGLLVLMALFAPYASAALNGALSFVTKPWQKKAVAIVIALLLTAIVLVGYYVTTGDTIPDWPVLVLLAIVVAQASYALVTKSTATVVEHKAETRALLRRDLR